MSKLVKFQDAAIQNGAEVKGGFFFGNYCAPQPNYCAPKPTSNYCAPQPNYCAPKPTSNYCAPQPNYCAPKTVLPKLSFSFSLFGGGCW